MKVDQVKEISFDLRKARVLRQRPRADDQEFLPSPHGRRAGDEGEKEDIVEGLEVGPL